MKKGKFIVAEGPDTAGKTTLFTTLKEVLPLIYKDEVFKFTREPGNLLNNSSNKSEELRKKILSDPTLTPDEQARLFAKARYYHTLEIIEELNKGNNVLTDRYLFSSIIYQGMDLGFETILEYNKESLDLLKENGIDINNIVLQITIDTYNERMANKKKDALEDVHEEKILNRINYHNTIDDINSRLNNSLGKINVIDATKAPSQVVIEALTHINNILDK